MIDINEMVNMIKNSNAEIINECTALIKRREETNELCELLYSAYIKLITDLKSDDKEMVSRAVCAGIELSRNFTDDYNDMKRKLRDLEYVSNGLNGLTNVYASMGLEDIVESFNAVKEVNKKYMQILKNTVELFENKYLKDVNFEAVGGIK